MELPDASSAEPALRIGLVGAGLIGRRHVQLIMRSASCELAGIVDPDPMAAEVARDAGSRRFDTLDGLVDSARPDGVIIAAPNALHLPIALDCIAARIPVLVEKPIATTVEDGARLAAAAVREGVPLLVGHHRRHSPRLRAARDVVASGALGRVVAVSATTMFAKPAAYFEAAAWRREAGSGGPILINLIHDIDALRMLVGDVVEVHAVAAATVRGLPVEESVAVSLQFANAAVGSMLLSDTAASPISWETTSGEDPAFPLYDDRDCYLLGGTHGSLGVPTLRLLTSDGAPSWRERLRTARVEAPRADPLAAQLEHFCDVIRRRAEPLVSGGDATESLRVTLAVAEAAATGRSVACAPP